MSNKKSFTSQISRAIRFVWLASPFWMIFNLIFQLLQGVFPILSLLLLKLMVDEVTASAGGSGDLKRLVYIIVLTGVVTLFSNLFSHLGDWGRREQSRHLADYMDGIIMKKGGEVDYPYFEKSQNIDTIERAAGEAQVRPGEIISTISSIIQHGVSLLGVIFLIAEFHPLIVVILLLSALPGLISRLFVSKQEFYNERKVTEKERMAGYFQFLMLRREFAKEVRLFNLTGEILKNFTSLRAKLRKIRHDLDVRNTIMASLSSVFMVFLVFASYIWVAGNVVTGTISVGAFVMFYQAFQKGQVFLRSFLGGVAALYSQNLYLRNLYQFLDYVPAVNVPDVPIYPKQSAAGEICVKNVSFTYPGTDKRILQNINLNLVPGEVVALVGLNGCGKTTLIKLLCRLYDVESGSITFDGSDVRELDPSFITDSVGVIFQDFMKYDLTVAQNISYGDMSSPPDGDRIREAARKAGIHSLIEDLPSGYETVLGVYFTDGHELSGGLWQKIAVARAFYKNAPLVIMDEPTSSLDPKAEYEIFNKFKEVLSGKTALIVSHRMATVKMADRICVMDRGVIAEEGTHLDLMNEKGLYYNLFTTQAQNYL